MNKMGDTAFWDRFTAPLKAAMAIAPQSWGQLKDIVRTYQKEDVKAYTTNALAYLALKELAFYDSKAKVWKLKNASSSVTTTKQNDETRLEP